MDPKISVIMSFQCTMMHALSWQSEFSRSRKKWIMVNRSYQKSISVFEDDVLNFSITLEKFLDVSFSNHLRQPADINPVSHVSSTEIVKKKHNYINIFSVIHIEYSKILEILKQETCANLWNNMCKCRREKTSNGMCKFTLEYQFKGILNLKLDSQILKDRPNGTSPIWANV